MAQRLTAANFQEMAARIQAFKAMPVHERPRHLGVVSPQRCNEIEANDLFDRFCRAELGTAGEDNFFEHLDICSKCYGAFLRLVWLSTDGDH